MERLIKFRVWDNVDYMSKPFTLKDIQEKKIEFTEECKVMQFTGLLDKSGKEIYEGDVVKRKAEPLWADQSDKIYEVKWRDMSFDNYYGITGWGIKDKDETFDIWTAKEKFEIIGNIYENLELLTPKDNE